MPSKAAQTSKICINENDFTQFDGKQNVNTFKNVYSKVASDVA